MAAFCLSANGGHGDDIISGQWDTLSMPGGCGHSVLLRPRLILCFYLYLCNTEISTSAEAVMIILCWGSWNFHRYIHDCVQVWLQQNILLGFSLASFCLKRLRHSLHDSIQSWSLHCLVACIIAFFPWFLCCAFNWQMLAVGLRAEVGCWNEDINITLWLEKWEKLNHPVTTEVDLFCVCKNYGVLMT